MYSIFQKKSLFLIVLLSSCNSNIYYGISGYGKLNFYNEKEFSLDYFDTGEDTGTYLIKKDTVFLSSKRQSCEIKFNTNYNRETIPIIGFIYSEDGCLKKEIILQVDIDTDEVILRNLELKFNEIIEFAYLDANIFRYVAKTDELINGVVNLDIGENRKLYFNNFILIKRGKFLIPIDASNSLFEKINNDRVMVFEKGNKNKPYKKYYSGSFIY